jgi:hypothetical protein
MDCRFDLSDYTHGSDDDSPGVARPLDSFAKSSSEWDAAPAERTAPPAQSSRARTPESRARANSGNGGGGGGVVGTAGKGEGGLRTPHSPRYGPGGHGGVSPRYGSAYDNTPARAMTPARAELRDYIDTPDVHLEDSTTFPTTPQVRAAAFALQSGLRLPWHPTLPPLYDVVRKLRSAL